ncbi:hypothetical protein [Chitinophaga flava]|uniref:Uncharacterized protein n=1 Tax=Chitinophaga flava TaxID=2259036 RepID=A0A365XSH5_9BACT|nr:hypothetical protein [Chitinophaga flava]RBL89309.1 hypothetical protein DF182_22570 [Chitinophaga flava]
MPTTIPYDPSLVLGSIVHSEVLKNLQELSAVQAPIDAAQDSLNSLISVRRSLDMTVQELTNLNVDATDIIGEISTLNTQIANAGKDYAKSWVDNIAKIKELKGKQQAVHVEYESPVDFNRTQIKNMALSADSLKLEAQYFSFDENMQSAQSTVSAIKSFISDSTNVLGDNFSGQASEAVSSQVSSQLERHDISGTLVISATCTHKDAALLAPLILDVDKGIRVWNKIFTDDENKIKTDSIANMQGIAMASGTEEEKSINIISGATYGSCFIGMVHVLNTTSTQSSQSMTSIAASMQAQWQVAGWIANETGGFGADSSFSNDIKNMLSAQNITSHVSLVTMGVIPSIKSNEVQAAVKQFSKFSPDDMMNSLASLANATTADNASVAQSASTAQTGARMQAMKASTINSVMSGLSTIDEAKNKMLDVNSMMTAFEDYVTKCIAGKIGVPINYYLKPITRSQLAEMWVSKYYPNKYLSISGDDSTTSGGTSTSTSTSAKTS